MAKAFYNENDDRFEHQLRKAALCNTDRQWLYNFIHQPKIASEQEQEEEAVVEAIAEAKIEKKQEVVIETPVLNESVDSSDSSDTLLKDNEEVRFNDSSSEIKTEFSPESEPTAEELKAQNGDKLILEEVTAEVKSEFDTKPDEKVLEEEEIPKINIAQGDGDVVTNVEEEVSQALSPKLQIEEEVEESDEQDGVIAKTEDTANTELVETNEKEVEVLVETIEKETVDETNDSHSFLDWLEYSSSTKNPEEQTIGLASKEEVNSSQEVEKTGQLNPSVTKTADLLEKFIANKPKPGEIKLEFYSPEEKAIASDSPAFIPISETLAEVYIEQNEKEMAIEIYEKLKLKFPEKSTYFADLIQKLNN